MRLPDFLTWIARQDESSAFTRLRQDADNGLKPPIADASTHSRSTFISKKKKKKKKKSK